MIHALPLHRWMDSGYPLPFSLARDPDIHPPGDGGLAGFRGYDPVDTLSLAG